MAWPKRNTRKFTVDGCVYLWHTSREVPFPWLFTIGQAGQPYVLYIDPIPHDFELKPKSVEVAIRWAVTQGWSPQAGPTRAVSFDGESQSFRWLPRGVRNAVELMEQSHERP